MVMVTKCSALVRIGAAVLLAAARCGGAARFLPECAGGWRRGEDVTTVCQTLRESDLPKLTFNDSSFVNQECNMSVGLWSCESETVKGVIVGPFVHRAGTWTSLQLPFKRFLAPDDRITQFTGDAIDAQGRVMPYPPLHLHHIHLTHSGPLVHWFETHGDYKMDPDGYHTRVPQGHCVSAGAIFEGKSNSAVQAIYNDVRFEQTSLGMGLSVCVCV